MASARPDPVLDFLGSVHGLATAVGDVIEKSLLQSVAGKKLSFAQFTILKLVALRDSQTIRDVATFLRVSDAAASKTVDKLVRLGLLRRVEGEVDRRAVRLLLTSASRRLLAAYDAAQKPKLASVFRGLPGAELGRTAQFLDRLSAEIIDHGSRPEEVCRQCGIYFRERCLVQQLVGRRCFFELQGVRGKLRLPRLSHIPNTSSGREAPIKGDRSADRPVINKEQPETDLGET